MKTAIVWFRKSLRLHDNPALMAACENEEVDSILPLFILDPDVLGENYDKLSPNRIRFLIESLSDLNQQLSSRYGSRLLLAHGKPEDIFADTQNHWGKSFDSLYCEYSSEPSERSKLASVKLALTEKNQAVQVLSFDAFQTILDVEKTVSSSGFRNPKSMKDMDQVFSTHFDKNDHGFYIIDDPLPAPEEIKPFPSLTELSSLSIEHLTEQISQKLKVDIMSVSLNQFYIIRWVD